jgi:starch-binding outer membrane protein SusE/F
MKYLATFAIGIAGLALILTGCDKKDSVPYYSSGIAPVLKSSVTSIAATPADSLNNVVSFSWTDPKFATDSGASPVKYVLQIDSAGRGFTKGVSIVLSGQLSDTFTAKQINTIVLGFGFSFNVAYGVDVRITASYANNNNQQVSNTLTLMVTPYKTPPKIPVPPYLYLVGDAVNTAPGNGWNTPVDTPYQKFTQVDSVTFGGIFNITGGNSYLLLPVANSFNNKYAIPDNTVGGADTIGSFQAYTSGGDNFPAPAISGWYQITVNFQTATYTVTPYTGPTVPLAITPTPSTLATGLWIIGDATPENPAWTNTVPALAGQQFTQLSNADFQITIALSSGGGYVFLPAAGDWGNKYGGTAAAGGPILFDGAVPGSNTPAPAASGNYLIDVNFATGIYTVTPK